LASRLQAECPTWQKTCLNTPPLFTSQILSPKVKKYLTLRHLGGKVISEDCWLVKQQIDETAYHLNKPFGKDI
jgi:hypothetical protein